MPEFTYMTKLVKYILEEDSNARNSDNHLYFRIIEYIGQQIGVNMDEVPVTVFFQNIKDFHCPGFETVRRTRQKIQRDFPELGGSPKIQGFRMEREEAFREFARG